MDYIPPPDIYFSRKVVAVMHVHDGDTFAVNIPDWPSIVGRMIDVRIKGIDAPEIHDPRPDIKAIADQARLRLIDLLNGAGGTALLIHLQRDKYFRILAGVTCAGIDAGAQLIREGLARPYNGEGPKPW